MGARGGLTRERLPDSFLDKLGHRDRGLQGEDWARPPPSLLVTEDAWPPRCTHRQAAQISQTAQLARQTEGRPRRPSDPHLAAPGNLGPSCQTQPRGCLRTRDSGQAGGRWGLRPCAHCAGQVRWRRPAPSKPRETRTPLPIQSPAAFPWPKKQTLAAPRKPPCSLEPSGKCSAGFPWRPLHPLCTQGVRVCGTHGACHLRAPESERWAQCGGEGSPRAGNPRAGPEAPGTGKSPPSAHSLEALY